MNNDDTQKLIEAMKQVFPTAEMVQREFTQTRKDMNDGFKVVKTRLDTIENILISKQDEKIKKLEERIKRIEEMLPS